MYTHRDNFGEEPDLDALMERIDHIGCFNAFHKNNESFIGVLRFPCISREFRIETDIDEMLAKHADDDSELYLFDKFPEFAITKHLFLEAMKSQEVTHIIDVLKINPYANFEN